MGYHENTHTNPKIQDKNHPHIISHQWPVWGCLIMPTRGKTHLPSIQGLQQLTKLLLINNMGKLWSDLHCKIPLRIKIHQPTETHILPNILEGVNLYIHIIPRNQYFTTIKWLVT